MFGLEDKVKFLFFYEKLLRASYTEISVGVLNEWASQFTSKEFQTRFEKKNFSVQRDVYQTIFE